MTLVSHSLRAYSKTTSHFHISASGHLWLLLNHDVLEIVHYSCGVTQSQQPNLIWIWASILQTCFWVNPKPKAGRWLIFGGLTKGRRSWQGGVRRNPQISATAKMRRSSHLRECRKETAESHFGIPWLSPPTYWEVADGIVSYFDIFGIWDRAKVAWSCDT